MIWSDAFVFWRGVGEMTHTAPAETEVVLVGDICSCGFYADDEDVDHGECA